MKIRRFFNTQCIVFTPSICFSWNNRKSISIDFLFWYMEIEWGQTIYTKKPGTR